MKIYFMSRGDFLANISKFDSGNYALISISDNMTERRLMQDILGAQITNCPYITTNFQDVDHDDGTGISNIQAKELLSFIKAYPNRDFIIHCFAGVSRSAAVAKFINEYYDAGNIALENYKIYNKLVYNKLKGMSGKLSMEDYYTQLEQEARNR